MTLFGSFFTVLFADKVILKRLAPRFVIPGPRFLITLLKYVATPFIVTGLLTDYLNRDCERIAFETQQKYSFGYNDYLKGKFKCI